MFFQSIWVSAHENDTFLICPNRKRELVAETLNAVLLKL